MNSKTNLYNAVNACLNKATALVDASIDFEPFTPDIIHDYLWALSDILQEAKCLYEKLEIPSQENK